MTRTEDYHVERFTKAREMITDAVNMSKYYNHIIGLIEYDVTKGVEIIAKHREKTGERLSFTSWVMKCIGQAVSENKVVQTFRKGRRKMIVFHDVDIKCLVEKQIKDRKVPIVYIIRKADKKSFKEINDEIRSAQKYDDDQREKERKVKNTQKLLMKVPQFIRRKVVWGSIMTNPFKIRKHFGTVGCTSMGMMGKGITGWAIPKTMHSTTFAIAGIVKKPVVRDDKIVIRDILHVVVEFNHDVVDGAPAVRCVARLYELLNEAYGLEDYM